MREAGRIKSKGEYEPHDCGGKIIDDEPHYIPLGSDSIMRIIDQRCIKCGCSIIGRYQKTEIIKNQKAHDFLTEIFREQLHPQKEG